MAVKREIRTTLALDGESEYKKALSEAQRGLRVLGSELKLASAEFETNGDKQAFLTAKSQTLRSEIAQQEEIVKSLEGAVKDAGEKYGETAKATDDYQIKLNSAKATLEKMRRELDATDREAQDLGRDSVRVGRQLEDGIGDGADQAKESLESMAAQMKQSLEEIKSSSFVTAAGSAWNMAQGVYQSASSLVESTRDYRMTVAKFKQTVEDNGFDYEWAQEQVNEVAGITGDLESAMAGVKALTETGWNTDEITTAIDNIVGACLKYDGTTFDGLAQSIQETISKGEATGQFAKVIESMGYDVNEFNEAMKNAETPTGKLQVALAYLTSSGLVETKKSFEQNNKQLIEAQSASNRLKEAWAGLGEKAGIVSTPIKNNLAAALEEVNALLGEITEKGFWKTFMEHGNDRPIQWDESSWLSPENWLTFEDISNYLQELFGTGAETAINEATSGLQDQMILLEEQILAAYASGNGQLAQELIQQKQELLKQSAEAAQAALDGVGDSLETGGDTAAGDAKTVGENLSTGIGNGITEKESVALAAAQTTVNNVAAVLGQLNSMVFSPTVSIGSPFTRGLYDLPTPSGGSTKGADKVGAQSLAVSVNVDGKAMAKAVFPHIDTLQGTAAARNNA